MPKTHVLDTAIYLDNPLKPQLRFMQVSDCAVIAELQAELDYSPWSQSQWVDALDSYPNAWILSIDKELVGYVIYQTLVAQVELLNLGISPSYQCKGLAQSLLQSTMTLLPSASESVFLEVRRSNVPAIKLYEKLNFQSVGIRPNYYSAAGGIREDALIYRFDFPKTS